MKWIKKNYFFYNWVATFPCDTPFFNISIIDEFTKASKSNDSYLYFAKTEEKRHNIFGLWSLKLADTLEEDIIRNNYRKVEKWADKVGVKTINVSYDNVDPFFNINTKEDLIEAKKIFKKIIKMIDYRKAQKILINSKINIKNEIIFANDSINRISAQSIYSPTNYPAGNNTAFDGFAVNSQETNRLSNKNIKKI